MLILRPAFSNYLARKSQKLNSTWGLEEAEFVEEESRGLRSLFFFKWLLVCLSILAKAFGSDLIRNLILNINNFSMLECVCVPNNTYLCDFLLLIDITSAAD